MAWAGLQESFQTAVLHLRRLAHEEDRVDSGIGRLKRQMESEDNHKLLATLEQKLHWDIWWDLKELFQECTKAWFIELTRLIIFEDSTKDARRNTVSNIVFSTLIGDLPFDSGGKHATQESVGILCKKSWKRLQLFKCSICARSLHSPMSIRNLVSSTIKVIFSLSLTLELWPAMLSLEKPADGTCWLFLDGLALICLKEKWNKKFIDFKTEFYHFRSFQLTFERFFGDCRWSRHEDFPMSQTNRFPDKFSSPSLSLSSNSFWTENTAANPTKPSVVLPVSAFSPEYLKYYLMEFIFKTNPKLLHELLLWP